MKKLNKFLPLLPFAILSLAVFLPSSAGAVTGNSVEQLNITISEVGQGIAPGSNIGTLISRIVTIIFAVGVITVLFMLFFGAFQWITSGGDKEAVAKARGRIMHALIGLAILALAFLLVRVIGTILGIDILQQTLPQLNNIPNA